MGEGVPNSTRIQDSKSKISVSLGEFSGFLLLFIDSLCSFVSYNGEWEKVGCETKYVYLSKLLWMSFRVISKDTKKAEQFANKTDFLFGFVSLRDFSFSLVPIYRIFYSFVINYSRRLRNNVHFGNIERLYIWFTIFRSAFSSSSEVQIYLEI